MLVFTEQDSKFLIISTVQYKEQLKHAEMQNYSRSLHLRQAVGNPMGDGSQSCHPDIC